MQDPIHPDDYTFSISGEVENPVEYVLEDLRKFPSRTVRAVTECVGNDGEFFFYLRDGSNVEKPSLRVQQNEDGGWNQMSEEGEIPTSRKSLKPSRRPAW